MTLAIIGIYFVILIVIGILAYLKIRGSTDQYFVAGRGLGVFINSWAFLASLASGGSLMAGLGTGMALGLPYIASSTAGAVVGFVVASILVARPLRNLAKFTIPDYFRDRYHSKSIAWAVPIIVLVGSLAYLVAQLKAASIITEYALGWNYGVGVVVTGLLFVVYVSLGGFLAVSWNDVFQGILMFCALVAVVIAGYLSLDSFTGAASSANSAFPALSGVHTESNISPASYIGVFLTGVTVMSVLPHVIMRVFSAPNVRSAKIALNVSMLIYSAMMIGSVVILTPVAAVVPGIGPGSGDDAFLLVTEHVIGPIGQGLMMAAILAAVMSTTAGLLMVCNAAIANDIYSRILRPAAPERQVVKVAGLSTWVVGAIAILFALNPPDFLIVLYLASQGFIASALFFPMVLGMWWRRCNDTGAIAGIIGGAVAFAFLFAFGDLGTSSEVVVALPVSAVCTIVGSLVSQDELTANAVSKTSEVS